MLLFITIIILAVGVCVSALRSKDYYTPFNIVAAFNLALFGGYWVIRNVDGLEVEEVTTRLAVIGLLGQALGMLIFPRVVFYSNRTTLGVQDAGKIQTARLYLWVIVSAFLVVAIYKVISRGSLSLYDLYRFEEGVTRDFGDLQTRLIGLFNRVATPVLMLCLAYAYHQKAGTQRALHYYAPLGLYFITMFAGYTGRSAVVGFLVAAASMHFAYNRRFQVLSAIAGFLSVALLLSALQFVRHGKDISSASEVASSLGDGGEWEPVKLISVLYENEKNSDIGTTLERIGQEIYYFTINWVPRPLWAGKPDTDFAARISGDYFGHTYARELWVRNFTVIGQGYYIAKEAGVFVCCFLYGLLVAFFVKLMRRYFPFEWYCHFFCFLAAYMFRNAVTTIFFLGVSQMLVIWFFSLVLGLKTSGGKIGPDVNKRL